MSFCSDPLWYGLCFTRQEVGLNGLSIQDSPVPISSHCCLSSLIPTISRCLPSIHSRLQTSRSVKAEKSHHVHAGSTSEEAAR